VSVVVPSLDRCSLIAANFQRGVRGFGSSSVAQPKCCESDGRTWSSLITHHPRALSFSFFGHDARPRADGPHLTDNLAPKIVLQPFRVWLACPEPERPGARVSALRIKLTGSELVLFLSHAF